MIGVAITAVQRLGDGVRWTAIRLARLHSWLLEMQRDEQADCARDVVLHERPTLRESIAEVRREVAASPPWLRDIYARNRAVEQQQRGAAVDAAARSLGREWLGGYDGSAHCVVCGAAAYSRSRCWTHREAAA